jgi:hypothetical protein
VRVVFSHEHIKAIEDDDDSEVPEGHPGEVWLERTLEDKSVAVDALGFQGLMKLDVRNTNRAPLQVYRVSIA